MALSSASITANNNPYNAGINVVIKKGLSLSSGVSYLKLYRKKDIQSSTYVLIYKKAITSIHDLDITFNDVTVQSGYNYTYSLDLTTGESDSASIVENGSTSKVGCWFDGLFIGDYSTQYVAQLNCNTSTTRITEVNYVTTLTGRTPYRVSNSGLNYTTGQSSGLFLESNSNNELIKSNNIHYVEKVIDYLTDGRGKILKTSDGGMWYVTIDGEVNRDFDNNYKGLFNISFNWTEIGDVPMLRTV